MFFLLPFPNIDPVLVQVGPFAVRWYALAYIVSILIGWWYVKREAVDARIWGPAGAPMTAVDIDDLVVWVTAGVILGGRIGYVLFYDFARFAASPLEIFAVWHGGMSFHGGFLGTVLAMALFARHRGIPAWSLIDLIATAVPIGLLFGRLANFINGELWGRATDVPWAMIFPNADALPRHPSQLYEAALEGVVLFLAMRFFTHTQHRFAQRGFISGIFALGYGLSRIVSEFFREPDIQIGYFSGGLTMGMLLSLPLVATGIILLVLARKQPVTVP